MCLECLFVYVLSLLTVWLVALQSTPAHERGKLLAETFGEWQTEEYIPPTAVDVSRFCLRLMRKEKQETR